MGPVEHWEQSNSEHKITHCWRQKAQFLFRNSNCVERFGNAFSETILWNVCNQTNEYTGSFCHSAKRSVCVCPIYRCLSLWETIKPCQRLSQSLIRGVIKVNSSLGCVFLPALVTSRVGIHTAFVLFAWGRSTLSQLSRELTVRIASASRCGRFAPGGLSLRREPSPTFLAAMVRLRSWGSQVDLVEGMETGASLSRDPALPPRARKHALMERFLPPTESARRSDCRPLRRAMARAPMNHPSLHSMRSLWRL